MKMMCKNWYALQGLEEVTIDFLISAGFRPSIEPYWVNKEGTIVLKVRKHDGKWLAREMKQGIQNKRIVAYGKEYIVPCYVQVGGHFVHRLVAHAFLGPCPKGMEVDHIDDDMLNNNANNLRYVTHEENLRKKVGKKYKSRKTI